MASAKQNQKVVTVETSYTIELSEREADSLVAVLRCVGGDPHHSRRRDIDKILGAMRAAGANPSTTWSQQILSGSMSFIDERGPESRGTDYMKI